uniref:Uncharacterized protein n=1 Tax=Rhizophora mucronata TaxID=61149 RepID=A0A2P2KU17_RHIMU
MTWRSQRPNLQTLREAVARHAHHNNREQERTTSPAAAIPGSSRD